MALKSIIPKMTSNNSHAPLYIITETDIHKTAYKAFDGNKDTYLRTSILPYEYMPYTLVIDLGNGNEEAVIAYDLINSYAAQWSMNTWTFEGSNDNSNWTVLHTVTNKTWQHGIKYFYEFENKIPYRYYRIKCTKINGDNSIVISEANLYVQNTKPSKTIKSDVVSTIKNHELIQKHLISILMEE